MDGEILQKVLWKMLNDPIGFFKGEEFQNMTFLRWGGGRGTGQGKN